MDSNPHKSKRSAGPSAEISATGMKIDLSPDPESPGTLAFQGNVTTTGSVEETSETVTAPDGTTKQQSKKTVSSGPTTLNLTSTMNISPPRTISNGSDEVSLTTSERSALGSDGVAPAGKRLPDLPKDHYVYPVIHPTYAMPSSCIVQTAITENVNHLPVAVPLRLTFEPPDKPLPLVQLTPATDAGQLPSSNLKQLLTSLAPPPAPPLTKAQRLLAGLDGGIFEVSLKELLRIVQEHPTDSIPHLRFPVDMHFRLQLQRHCLIEFLSEGNQVDPDTRKAIIAAQDIPMYQAYADAYTHYLSLLQYFPFRSCSMSAMIDITVDHNTLENLVCRACAHITRIDYSDFMLALTLQASTPPLAWKHHVFKFLCSTKHRFLRWHVIGIALQDMISGVTDFRAHPSTLLPTDAHAFRHHPEHIPQLLPLVAEREPKCLPFTLKIAMHTLTTKTFLSTIRTIDPIFYPVDTLVFPDDVTATEDTVHNSSNPRVTSAGSPLSDTIAPTADWIQHVQTVPLSPPNLAPAPSQQPSNPLGIPPFLEEPNGTIMPCPPTHDLPSLITPPAPILAHMPTVTPPIDTQSTTMETGTGSCIPPTNAPCTVPVSLTIPPPTDQPLTEDATGSMDLESVNLHPLPSSLPSKDPKDSDPIVTVTAMDSDMYEDTGYDDCYYPDTDMLRADDSSHSDSMILPSSTAAPPDEHVEDLSANSQYETTPPVWPWTSNLKDNVHIDEINFYLLGYLLPDYLTHFQDPSIDASLKARKDICRRYFTEPEFKNHFNFLLDRFLNSTSSSPLSFKYAGTKLNVHDLIDNPDTRPSLSTLGPVKKSPRLSTPPPTTHMDLSSDHPAPCPPSDTSFPWTNQDQDMLLIDHLNSKFLAICYPTMEKQLLHDNSDISTAARRELILRYKNDLTFRHLINDAVDEYEYKDQALTTPITSFRILPTDQYIPTPVSSRPPLTDITLPQTTYETSFTHDKTTFKIQCHFTPDTIALVTQYLNSGMPLLDIASFVVRTTPTLSLGFSPARHQAYQHHSCPKYSGSYYTTHGQIEGLRHGDRSVLTVSARCEAGSLHSASNRKWILQWLDRTCEQLFTAETQALYEAHRAARNWIESNSDNLDDFSIDRNAIFPPLSIFTADVLTATLPHFPSDPPIAYFLSQPNALRVRLFCGTGLQASPGLNFTFTQLQSLLQHNIVRVNPVGQDHQYSFHSTAICSDAVFEEAISRLAGNIRVSLNKIPQLRTDTQQQASGSVHSLRHSLTTRSFVATHVVIGSLSNLLLANDETSRVALYRTIKSLFRIMNLGTLPANLKDQLLTLRLNPHSFHICDTFDNPTHRFSVIVLQLRDPITTKWNDTVRIAGVHRTLLTQESDYGMPCSEISWPLLKTEKGKEPKIMYTATLIPSDKADIACSARPVMATRNLFTHITLDAHVHAADTFVRDMTDFPTITIGLPLFDTLTTFSGSSSTSRQVHFATYGTLTLVQTETPDQTLYLQKLLQIPTAEQMRIRDEANPLRIKRLSDCYLVDVAPHLNAFQNQPLPPKVAEARPSVKALRFCRGPPSWTPLDLLDTLLSKFPEFPTAQIRDVIYVDKGHLLALLHWTVNTDTLPTSAISSLSFDVLPHLPFYVNTVHPFNAVSKKTIVFPRPPTTDNVGYSKKTPSRNQTRQVTEATPSAPPVRGPPSTTIASLPHQGTSTKE